MAISRPCGTNGDQYHHLTSRILPMKYVDESNVILLINGSQILHYSVWYGRLNVAEFAIEHAGANVNAVDQFGLTPLHFCVVRNYSDMTRLLLSFGADDLSLGGHFTLRTPLELAQSWTFCDTSASRHVLQGLSCVCCNATFNFLLRPKVRCDNCTLYFCNIPRSCLLTHHCTERGNVSIESNEWMLMPFNDKQDITSTSSEKKWFKSYGHP